jgi:hypothetical protein
MRFDDAKGLAMYKRASLRTGGSALSGTRKNTRKPTEANDYRLIERMLRKRTGKGIASGQQRLARLRKERGPLRKKWAPYIESCIQAGKKPHNLPSAIRAEIKEAGSLRNWLAFYASFVPLRLS